MAVRLLAVVKNGKIESLDPIDLPEGTQLLITVDSDREAEVWAVFGGIEPSLYG